MATDGPTRIYGDDGSGVATAATRPFDGLTSASNGVVNVTIGGHIRPIRDRNLRLHAGFATSRSPAGVADQVFSGVDVSSWNVGVSGTLAKFQFAVGVNLRTGAPADVLVRDRPGRRSPSQAGRCRRRRPDLLARIPILKAPIGDEGSADYRVIMIATHRAQRMLFDLLRIRWGVRHVRFDHPQGLIDTARYFGKQVRGVRVVQRGGVVDGFADPSAKGRERLPHRLNVRPPVTGVERVIAQLGLSLRPACSVPRATPPSATPLSAISSAYSRACAAT